MDVDVSGGSLIVSLNPRLVEAASTKKTVKGKGKKLQHSVVRRHVCAPCDIIA